MSCRSRSVARLNGKKHDNRLAFRFTNMRSLHFVELYGREPCLWSQQPYLETARNAAYKRIQAGINALIKSREAPLSLKDVQIKITDLRRCYNQELQKMNVNPNYKPKAPWFKPLHSFLAKCSDKDSNRSSSPQLKELKIRLTRLKPTPLPSQVKIEPDEVLVTVREPNPKRSAFTTLPAPMPPMPPVPAIPLPSMPSPVTHFTEISTANMGKREGRAEDEFTFFGLSVAAQLRNMPLESAMIMQSKIQYLLSMERRKINGHSTEINIFN